jgi:hypothetical protein
VSWSWSARYISLRLAVTASVMSSIEPSIRPSPIEARASYQAPWSRDWKRSCARGPWPSRCSQRFPGAGLEIVLPARLAFQYVASQQAPQCRVAAQDAAGGVGREESHRNLVVGFLQGDLGALAAGALDAHLLRQRHRHQQAGTQRGGDAIDVGHRPGQAEHGLDDLGEAGDRGDHQRAANHMAMREREVSRMLPR